MKKIAVIPNIIKDKDFAVTKKLIACLEEYADVCVERVFEGVLPHKYIFDDIFELINCAIVIGGDGTILNAAVQCAEREIPILGINLGKIGFMAEIEVDEIEEAVKALISGDFITEERMMLKIQFCDNGVKKEYHALNDVVISKTDNSTLINMDLYSGRDMINRYAADGLIISTPTGSTGYNLSAGGPVVNPLMELFVATPICAHMLTARPAILPVEESLSVELSSNDENCAIITVDGVIVGKIKDRDSVVITKSKLKTKIIKIHKQSFYNVFVGKLS